MRKWPIVVYIARGRIIVGRIANLIWFLFTWFLLVGVVCAALLTYHFYGRVDEKLRTFVESSLAEQYPGLEVSVRFARLIEREGIRIGGVTMAEHVGDRTLREVAYIDEVLVRCKPTLDDLLEGHVEVTHVTIRNAILRSVRNSDGTWSIRSIAKLPKFGGRSTPSVFVDDATLEIRDPTRRPGGLLVVRDIQMQIRPDLPAEENGTQRLAALRMEGSFSGDHLQRSTVQAVVDPENGRWRVLGQVAGLALSPAFVAAVPTEAATRLEALGELQGHCAFTFDLASASSGDSAPTDPKMTYEINGSMVDGRLAEAALPLPLTDLSATFSCTRQALRVDNVQGRFGEAVVRMSCHRNGVGVESLIQFDGTVENIRLERSLVSQLPMSWQETWDKLRPVGKVTTEFHFRRELGVWNSDLKIQCHELGFTWERFPYPVESTQGTVRIRGDQFEFDLASDNPRQPLRLRGNIFRPGEDWFGWLEAIANKPLALDEQLIRATSKQTQRLARAFSPHGSILFHMRVARDENSRKVQEQLDLQWIDGSLRHVAFPYPLHSVTGRLVRRDNEWTIRDFSGTNDSARIKGEGTFSNDAAGGTLRLRLTGTNLPLEEELQLALSPPIQGIWQNLQPQGTLDSVTADLVWKPGTDPPSISVLIEEKRPEDASRRSSVSIYPERFPYRIDRLQGVLRYANGKVVMQDLRGQHGDVTIRSNGTATVEPNGHWSLAFDDLSVDRLRVGSELLHALPPALQRMLVDMHPVGTIWMNGQVKLASAPGAASTVNANWNLLVDFEDAALSLGTPLEHLFGQVALRGASHGTGFSCRGTLDMDSVMSNGVQLSSVRGPIYVDPNRFVAGAWVGPTQDGENSPPLEAVVAGGRMEANFQSLRNDVGRFDAQIHLADARLSQFALSPRISRGIAPQGRVWADFQLAGNRQGRHNLRGQGQARLRDANYYELPFFLSLIKTMRTGSTDRTAFTSSDANFRLQGDHIYFDNLDLIGDTLTMKGVGEMNLNRDLKLDFYTVVGREEAYLPAIRPLLGMASRRFLVVKVEGHLENPSMTRDVLPDLNGTLQQLFPDADAVPHAPVVKLGAEMPVNNAVQPASSVRPH